MMRSVTSISPEPNPEETAELCDDRHSDPMYCACKRPNRLLLASLATPFPRSSDRVNLNTTMKRSLSKFTPPFSLVLCVAVLALTLLPAQAANKWWQGGAGTANNTSANWHTSDVAGTATTLATTDKAIFSVGASGTAFTISGTPTATGGLTVEDGTVTIGGTWGTFGAAPLQVNSGATLVISVSTSIPTTAGSVLTLNGGRMRNSNTATTGSFIDVDTAIVLNGGGILSGTGGSTAQTIVQATSVISGTGPLTKDGNAIVAVAAVCTYSGATIINDGQLRCRTTANVFPTATDVTVTSPGIFSLNSVNQRVGSLTGNGTVTLGSATLTIGGSASPAAFSGAITSSSSGDVTKTGSGTLTLSGPNDFNGTLTLTSGTITVNSGGALCNPVCDVVVNGGSLNLNNTAQKIENLSGTGGTITLDTGHTLSVGPIASVTYSGTITGAGNLIKTNTTATIATLTLSGNNTYDGVTTIDAGTITAGSATALGSTVGKTVVKSGNGLNFTGVTFTISEDIDIDGTGSTVTSPGAIFVQGTSTVTFDGTITLTADATVSVAGSSTSTYNNAAAFTATDKNLTLQGGTLAAGTGGFVSGAITLGTGGLTKSGSGRWNLSGANSFSGNTTVTAGTLQAGAVNTLASASPIVVTGGTLDIQTFNQSVPSVQITGGTISGSTGVLTSAADYDAQAGTISAILGGSVGLNKTTAGTVALQGINAYTGDTTISDGALSVDADATIGDGTGTVFLSGGSILSKNTRSGVFISNPISMTTDATIYGDSTTAGTRIIPFSGSLTASAGTLTIRNTGITGTTFRPEFHAGGINFSRPIVVGHASDVAGADSELAFLNPTSTDQTFSGDISGSGSLRRTASGGGGRTILTGNNTYSGGTTITLGTLLVNNTVGSGTGTGAVTVNGGVLGGTGTIAGLVTVNSGATLAPGASIGDLTLTLAPTLNAGGTNAMEIDKATGPVYTSDQLVVSTGGGTLTYGGTLTVTATGDPLDLGDTFDLFDADAFAGAFSTYHLPALTPGLQWDTSQLTVDGTISVVCNPATVNAGLDQTNCAGANFTLAGVIGGGASSATWSGGAGTFTPNAATLNASYTPTAGEISAGSVTLTLTTDDPVPACAAAVADTVTLTIDTLLAGNSSYQRNTNMPVKIRITDLLTNASHNVLGPIWLAGAGTDGFNLTSATGSTLTTNASFIFYTESVPANAPDSFTYSVVDNIGCVASATINITVSTVAQTSSNVITLLLVGNPGPNTNTISLAGVPNYEYVVQFSTNLVDWESISTNTASPSNGQWQVIDDTATNATRYYRSMAR